MSKLSHIVEAMGGTLSGSDRDGLVELTIDGRTMKFKGANALRSASDFVSVNYPHRKQAAETKLIGIARDFGC